MAAVPAPTFIPSIEESVESVLTQTPTGTSQDFMATFCIFDQYIKQHIKNLGKENSSADLSEIYSKFSKGVEAKLYSGAFAEDRLSAQTKAIHTRKQQNQNNRRLPSDGRLTVKNARAKIREKNLKRDAQSQAAEEKRQARNFKAWHDQLQRIAFNNKPVSKTFPKPGTDKKSREIPFQDQDLKCWQAVICQIDTPYQDQKTLEERELDDKQCVAACRTLNPVTLLSSSPVPGIDPMMINIDKEEVFGFRHLPNHKVHKTQSSTRKISNESSLHNFSDADMDDMIDVDIAVEEYEVSAGRY